MVSSRALEYVSRFSKGVGNERALEIIVEYREECKQMYHDAETGNVRFNNYPARKNYLEDMLERIHALGEARDYLQQPMKSAVPFKAPMKSAKAPVKPAKFDKDDAVRKLFSRTENNFKGLDPDFVQYVLRFQGKGLAELSALECVAVAEDKLAEWESVLESDDEHRAELAEKKIDTIQEVINYFNAMNEAINNYYDTTEYVAGSDEYVEVYIRDSDEKQWKSRAKEYLVIREW